MRDKLRITEDECIERAVHAVSYAKKYVEDVQFYAEDAGPVDFAFSASGHRGGHQGGGPRW